MSKMKMKPAAAPSFQPTHSPTAQAAPAAVSPAPSALHPTIQRAVQLTERGDYEAALQLLRSNGQDRETLNAIGVCLMRSGQAREAVKLFRTMVLMPGCTWMRPELPTRYKTNFATALLLAGHPAGCLEMLQELHENASPVLAKLRGAIQRWESTLGLWRWLDWRFCGVEPPKALIPIDFPPGDFTDPLPSDRPAATHPLGEPRTRRHRPGVE